MSGSLGGIYVGGVDGDVRGGLVIGGGFGLGVEGRSRFDASVDATPACPKHHYCRRFSSPELAHLSYQDHVIPDRVSYMGSRAGMGMPEAPSTFSWARCWRAARASGWGKVARGGKLLRESAAASSIPIQPSNTSARPIARRRTAPRYVTNEPNYVLHRASLLPRPHNRRNSPMANIYPAKQPKPSSRHYNASRQKSLIASRSSNTARRKCIGAPDASSKKPRQGAEHARNMTQAYQPSRAVERL